MPPPDVPEPTLLTDLTSLEDDNPEPAVTFSAEAAADAEQSNESGDLGDIDFSISGEEESLEDPNEPLNVPVPKKKAG